MTSLCQRLCTESRGWCWRSQVLILSAAPERVILLIQFSSVLNGHHDDSLEITPYKGIQDSLESVQVLDSGFFVNRTWIPDSNCW